MSEVASHYGKSKIVLKRDWDKMMDLRFLLTLMQTTEVLIPSPLGIGDIGLSSFPNSGKMQVMFSVTDFFPATASGGDTDIERIVPGASEPSTGGEDWGTISAGNGTSGATNNNTTLHLRYFPLSSSNKWYILGRLLFQLDTSALDDSASISAATMSLYVSGKSDTDGQFGDIGIASCSPALTVAYVVADFQTCGSTIFSDYLNYDSGLPSGQYNIWTLNSDGRAAVSKTGFTKLSLQMKEDITGSQPTHSYNGGHNNNISVSAADTSGTSQDPKLSVTVPDPFSAKVMVIM